MTIRMLVAVCSISLSATAVAGATICDNSRDPCVPNPGSPAASVAKKPAAKKVHVKPAVPKSAELEKAPPDAPRPPMIEKRASVWMPIEIPSQRVQPEPATDGASVRVVSADEVNEIDLASASQVTTPPIKVVPIRVALDTPQRSVTASRTPEPADTSLLDRVMLTFGGAFGAASAFRVFFG